MDLFEAVYYLKLFQRSMFVSGIGWNRQTPVFILFFLLKKVFHNWDVVVGNVMTLQSAILINWEKIANLFSTYFLAIILFIC